MPAGHEVVWELEKGSLVVRLKCNEPGVARCRWTATCDCEVFYDMGIDAEGPYHYSEDFRSAWAEGETAIKHRMSFNGDCVVENYVNEDFVEECCGIPYLEVARTPVEVEWDGGSYTWVPKVRDEVADKALRHDQPEYRSCEKN